MRALCLALALMLALPLSALAHAQLRAADPAPGAMLADMPDVVTLRFNEAVAPLVLRWIGPDGMITEVSGQTQGDSLIVTPPAGIGSGTQFLSWRVISADGHPVGGTHSYHIGAPTRQAKVTDPPASGAARVAVAARAVVTLALAVALGAVLVPLLISATPPDRALRRGGLAAVALGLAAALTLAAAEGLNLMSLPPAAVVTPAQWLALRAAAMAEALAVIGLALVMAGLALAQPPQDRGRRLVLALGAWALGAASFALSGHGATAEPQAVARAALVLHGGALLVWLGALWPLVRLTRARGGAPALARFGRLITPLVAVLILSGLVLTWLQTRNPMDLFGAPWGVILSAKLALVGALLGLALRNRLVLTPALAADAPAAAPRLARAIRAEILLAIVIVILASSLRLMPPPRALLAVPEPLYAHFHGARAMADIRLSSGPAAAWEMTLGFQTDDFTALAPREVTVILAQPGHGIEPLRITARPGADGLWHTDPFTLPRPGEWEVTLRLLISDFESVTLRDTLRIAD